MLIGLSATTADIAAAIYTQEGPVRNNNPGNLRYVGQAGATGQDSRGFAIFPTLAAGQAAEVAQLDLLISRGTCATGAPVSSLSDVISCLSPPSENDTATYINRVSAATGLDPNAPLAGFLDGTGAFDTGIDAGTVVLVLAGIVAVWLLARS